MQMQKHVTYACMEPLAKKSAANQPMQFPIDGL